MIRIVFIAYITTDLVTSSQSTGKALSAGEEKRVISNSLIEEEQELTTYSCFRRI